jgi:uncharacterized protein YjbI with pentapeptide repeats
LHDKSGATDGIGWPSCCEPRCRGAGVGSSGHCVAHADSHEFEAYLRDLTEGHPLDLRGVHVMDTLMTRLLSALPHDADGRITIGEILLEGSFIECEAIFAGVVFTKVADFQRASFAQGATFDGARFADAARFDGATFEADVSFVDAAFDSDATFGGVTFKGETSFDRAAFGGVVWFDGSMFAQVATFARAIFRGRAWYGSVLFLGDTFFIGCKFDDVARFVGSTFAGLAVFSDTFFADSVQFEDVSVAGEARFSSMSCNGDVRFDRTRFDKTRALGPMRVAGLMSLDTASFTQWTEISVRAAQLSYRNTRFDKGADLKVRHASVVLEGTQFGGPSLVSGEDSVIEGNGDVRPRVLTLRDTDVRQLSLRAVDLRNCRFVGALGLEDLRFDREVEFPRTTGRWQADRVTIIDEEDWRATYKHRVRRPVIKERLASNGDEVADQILESGQSPTAAMVADLYRALRVGCEKREDPLAADFRYGEQEMRRRSTRNSGAERALLIAYWLFSGYGMRASRILGWTGLGVLIYGTLYQALNPGPEGPIPIISGFAQAIAVACFLQSVPPDLPGFGLVLVLVARIIFLIMLALGVAAAARRLHGSLGIQSKDPTRELESSVESVRSLLEQERRQLTTLAERCQSLYEQVQARTLEVNHSVEPESRQVLSVDEIRNSNRDEVTLSNAIQASTASSELTRARVIYGASLTVAAFILLAVVAGIAVWQFSNPVDVIAVIGPVTTVIGTIIGVFFGVQIGSAGKEAAEAGRVRAENAARIALAHLDPAAASEVMRVL